MSATRLIAKPYVPPMIERPARDIRELIFQEGPPEWAELLHGERGGMNVSGVKFKGTGRRDLTVGNDAAGGYLKSSSQQVDAIGYLHARLRCAQAGAEPVPVMEFISHPKITNPGAAYWLGESEPVTESNLTFGSAASTVKTVGAHADFTRQLKALTGPLAGAVVARELFGLLASAVDKAALCGTGADGQPQGIKTTTGVDTRSGATFAAATATAMLKVVEDGNAEPTAWIMDPASAELLRRREAASGSGFLIDGTGRIYNVPVLVTSGMDANTIILGDYRELLILSRAVELLVNPYLQGNNGIIQVTAFHYLDVIVRHPEVFAVATAVS